MQPDQKALCQFQLLFIHAPESFSVTGANVTFSVTTSVAEGFTYQWQYSKNGVTWTNTTMSGCNTATLTVSATKARNGYQYRCVLTGSQNSKIESKSAVLHVGDPIAVTAQPEGYVGSVGQTAVFEVEAYSEIMSYKAAMEMAALLRYLEKTIR